MFENVLCVKCNHTLGYLSDVRDLSALEPGENGEWRALSPAAGGRRYRMCENYSRESVCNCMVPVEDDHPLCLPCRLNHTIPNLNVPDNPQRWARVEAAKRRLIYTLQTLNLPVVDKATDPRSGLAFDLLLPTPDGPPVLTGHLEGLITINVAEADPDVREKMRREMSERYRTLIGHFRHEIGHYYWNLLIRDTDQLAAYREMFGDERADYAEALRRNYEQGVSEGWQENYVSSYAASHPWEDWAETWGNYLHIVDTLETARDARLMLLQTVENPERPVPVPDLRTGSSFERLLSAWFPLTFALNNINRGLGHPDLYPFFLSDGVIAKLRYVHQLIERASVTSGAPVGHGSRRPREEPLTNGTRSSGRETLTRLA